MDLRLLGHFEWSGADGVPVAIPGPSCRAVMAMLGLKAGAVMRADEIVEGLWGPRPPRNPDAALQVVMSRLRHALAGDRELLVHVRGGYELALLPVDVDVARARRSLDEGRALTENDDLAGASRVLAAGLNEWRHDSPLAEFADHPFAAGAAGDLMVLRAELVHACNEVALRLGRPQEVVARTERMLALDPWREDLVAQLMTALRDLGRRVEALGVYATVASVLRADFGADPAPELKMLERELRAGLDRSGVKTAATSEEVADKGAPSLVRSIRAAIAEMVDEESDPLIRCRLELALGQAEHLAGVADWQDTLRQAAATARMAGDPVTRVRCGLASTMGWSITPGRPDAERLEDLAGAEEAEGLPDELKARALAAYALELAFSAPIERRVGLSNRALRIARASGQPSLLLWVLNHRFNAIWAPETLTIRQRETEEACRLASRSGHRPAQALAAGFAMAAAVESGDLGAVDRHLADFEAGARDLGWPLLTWGVAVHSGWRAMLAGDLTEAEMLAHSARIEGKRGDRPEADLIHTSQIAAIRWMQRRLGEVVAVLEPLVAVVPGLASLRAVGLLHSGRSSEAAEELRRAWTSGAVASLPHDQLYLASLAHWAEVAVIAGEREVSAGIYRLLLPSRQHWIFTGAAVYGPVSGALGLLARALGEVGVAAKHLDVARRQCAAMKADLFAERLRLVGA